MQRKLSKNMSPNSRPPLTSRIRASFDGKRSKSEVTSPTTNGFITQDPDALRHAIDEAINSETFQTAIAANLAKLIKPSIKSALDTIQPVVEAVYNHEVLLRKTNQSVENILERIDSVADMPVGDEDGDPSTPVTPRRKAVVASNSSADVEGVKQLFAENNKQTDTKFSELSSSVEANNGKIAEVMEGIAGINAALWPTRDALDSLKSFSEHSNTTTSVMQAQLDQLNADVGAIMDAIGTNAKAINQPVAVQDNSLLSAHSAKLDTISTDIAALKGHADTADILKDISANLEALKENVQAGIASTNENFAAINPQLGSVLASVEAHSGRLAEMNSGDANPEVLAAIQKSNDFHAAHAVALSEIKERSSSGSESAPASSSPETVAALQALAADLASLKENIQAGLATNNDIVASVDTKVDDVLTTLEAHRAADPSADILAAVQKSNDSHASHTEALEGIRSINAEPKAVISSDDSKILNLEPQIATIIAKLDSHSTLLGDIKTSSIPSETEIIPTAGASNLAGLETQIATITNTLESHTTMLTEIKDDVSAEILTVLHDINEAHSSQNTVLAEIRDSDVSDEILTALHASNDYHANHTVVLTDLHAAVQASNDSHASHAGILDEIKTTRSVEPGPASEAPSNIGGLQTQIGSIIATLEDQNTTLSAIKDAANSSNESHVAHASTLAELKAARNVETSAAAEVPSSVGGPDARIDTILTTLEGQNVTLSAIKDATDASNDFHSAHTSILTEIKEATAASNESHNSHAVVLGDVKSAVDASTDSHAEHNAALAEIKDITSASNDFHSSHMMTLSEIKEGIIDSSGSHASHSADLAEIKDASKAANDLHASHITALTEFKAVQPSGTTPTSDAGNGDLSALETHINSIISILDTQNATLSDIKEATSSPEVLAAVKESHELLKSHTPLLDSIKDGQSHADILENLSDLKAIIEESRAGIIDNHGAAVKDLHESTKASHSEITTAISALALGGAAGAGAGMLASKDDNSSAEILEEVKSVRAIVESSSTSLEAVKETTISMAAQIDINHTTVTTSINTLSDELKAEIDATGTDISTSLEAVSGDVKSIDLSQLNTAVEQYGNEVKELNATIVSLNGSVKGTGAHIAGLIDGVHLNEKGIGQLQEHAALTNSTSSIAPKPRENWWKDQAVDDAPASVIHEPVESPVLEAHAPEPEIPTMVEPTIEDQPATESDPVVDSEPIPRTNESVLEPKEEDPEAPPVIEEPATHKEESTPAEPIGEVEDDKSSPEIDEPEPETKEEEPEAAPVIEEPVVQEVENTPADPIEEVHDDESAPEISKPVQQPELEEEQEAAPIVEEETTPVEVIEESQGEEPTPEINEPVEKSELSPEMKEDTPVEHDEEPVPPADEPEPEPKDEEPEAASIIEEPTFHEESAAARPIEEVQDTEPIPEVNELIEEPELNPELIEDIPVKHTEEPVAHADELEPGSPEEPHKDGSIEEETLPAEEEDIPRQDEVHAHAEPTPEINEAVEEPELSPELKDNIPVSHVDEVEPASPIQPLKDDPIEEETVSMEKEEASTQEEITHAEPTPELEDPDLEEDSATIGTESASTSAIASPMSPSFPGEGSASGKKGKKGKKAPKEKKGKKDKKAPFVFDPDEEEEERPAA